MVNIKQKVKDLESKFNLNYFELLQRFMFERVLERISVSKYQDNFILKGGLLLTAIFGIDNRTTKDMDITIHGIDISKENMLKIINEILSIDLKDGVKFDIVNIDDIMSDDEYGGNKYRIIGRVFNTKINLEIDISTGDKVTPKELRFKYFLVFEDKNILINSYNIETILAEKIETILRRGIFNSRMKDYYDIHFFLIKLKRDINIDILKEAIKNTFNKRKSFSYLNDYKKILETIKNSEKMHELWNIYSNKNKYANNINFIDIIINLEEFINELNLGGFV